MYGTNSNANVLNVPGKLVPKINSGILRPVNANAP